MTFFLKPGRRGEDAVRPPTPASDPREAFANELAAYRKATGKPESRAIPCRCAVTARPFTLQFERVSPAHRFQIARIEAATEGGGERRLARSLFTRAPQLRSYDIAEFDWAGCICPHCRASGLINCSGCGEEVCGGRVRTLPDGGRAFACHDGCGATGEIEPATQIQGTAASFGPTPVMKALPRPQAHSVLPGSKRLRLPGPKR